MKRSAIRQRSDKADLLGSTGQNSWIPWRTFINFTKKKGNLNLYYNLATFIHHSHNSNGKWIWMWICGHMDIQNIEMMTIYIC